MKKYITKGTVTAVLSLGALGAAAFGKAHLAAYLNDPDTATLVLGIFGSVGTLVAGVLEGVK